MMPRGLSLVGRTRRKCIHEAASNGPACVQSLTHALSCKLVGCFWPFIAGSPCDNSSHGHSGRPRAAPPGGHTSPPSVPLCHVLLHSAQKKRQGTQHGGKYHTRRHLTGCTVFFSPGPLAPIFAAAAAPRANTCSVRAA